METAFMKLIIPISTTTLFVLLGTTAAAYASRDRQEQGDKREKQEEKAKPEKKEEKANPGKSEPHAKPARQEQENKPVKQETKQANKDDKNRPANEAAKQAKQEQKVEHVKQQDQPSGQRSHSDDNRGHGRISDEHYRASFGRDHNFHVNKGDYDHRRFNYGGYSFGFIDPWPEAWYYTDNVYVVYEGGGYYMYDAIHPGMRISVNIL
jgi:hypothetical protein